MQRTWGDAGTVPNGLCTDLYEIWMAAGFLRRDMTAPATPSGTEALPVPAMRGGRRVAPPDAVTHARERFGHDLERLPPGARRLHDPRPPTATRSVALRTVTAEVSRRLDRRAVTTP